MRHKKRGRKLGRKTAPRKALLKNLAQSLIKEGKIKTTSAKAKELRPFIEKLVTRAKVDSVANRRIIESEIYSSAAVKKLFTDIAPKYADKKGGYTRIIKAGVRLGDNASVSVIEFVGPESEEAPKKEKKPTKKTDKTKKASKPKAELESKPEVSQEEESKPAAEKVKKETNPKEEVSEKEEKETKSDAAEKEEKAAEDKVQEKPLTEKEK